MVPSQADGEDIIPAELGIIPHIRELSHPIDESLVKTRNFQKFKLTRITSKHKPITCKSTDQVEEAIFRWFRRRRRLRSLVDSTTYVNKHYFSLWIVFVFLLTFLITSIPPIQSSDFINNNINKNSGQFSVSQLCAGKSQFPITKRVEGAVLSSFADTNVNCTIIFRTRSAQQHFVIRFEELRLGCDDHLKMFDGDLDYGQPSIKDFSCRDSLANVPIIKTTGTYLTLRLSTDSKTKPNDGFRLVVTAVLDVPIWDCPNDYTSCHNRLCISKSLFCDGTNHCLDNSDETSCSSRLGGVLGGKSSGDGIFGGEITLSNALGLLVILVLVIFTCVIIFISAVYCRRESHYAQYQHHLQRAIGVPLQTSSSLMFTTNQPQYHYFQPANFSPYVTPQHQAMALANATLPRGYSTLPLNMARQPQPLHTVLTSKGTNHIANANNSEYLMMAGIMGQPNTSIQPAPTMQTNLFLPTSQSILANTVTATSSGSGGISGTGTRHSIQAQERGR